MKAIRHNEFCRPRHVGAEDAAEKPEQRLTFINLDNDVLALVKCIAEEEKQTLQLYHHVWETYVHKAISSQRPLSLQDVVKQIWQPTEKDFEQNIKRIENGLFTFQEIDDMLSKFRGL